MHLPQELIDALAQMMDSMPKAELSRAAAELTGRYRSSDRDRIGSFMTTGTHRLAYLSYRMPAAYAVVRRVLEELSARMPLFRPVSLGDLGAGPGTASWAAVDAFPSISRVKLLEKDANWQSLGKKLMEAAGSVPLKQAEWEAADLADGTMEAEADLLILSYVIGELPPESLGALVDRAWGAAQGAVVFIEPGTPHGFERIRFVRNRLIELGAHLAAPCPHMNACPMQGGDWCHFSERLERSSLHRAVKDVGMGYEDEKYSYVIASKEPVRLPEARIVRHPERHSGHIDFEVCARDGLEKRIVSKRHKDLYKAARKLGWGDALPVSDSQVDNE